MRQPARGGQGHGYLNVASGDVSEFAAEAQAVLARHSERLASVKMAYDPDNLFRRKNKHRPAGSYANLRARGLKTAVLPLSASGLRPQRSAASRD
jgi:hypothetical protein